MNITNLIDELGNDVDLLSRHDEWLEEKRRATANKMDELANELRIILLAQRTKRILQQKNKVAIQHLLRNENGEVKDIAVRIDDLPDALYSARSQDIIDNINILSQLDSWEKDGYDINGSSALRSA